MYISRAQLMSTNCLLVLETAWFKCSSCLSWAKMRSFWALATWTNSSILLLICSKPLRSTSASSEEWAISRKELGTGSKGLGEVWAGVTGDSRAREDSAAG